MNRTIQGCRVELLQGDITAQRVDAVVNAANGRLAGGGGVDGAIHRAGGPEIMAETERRYPDGCPTGSAVLTAAGKLPARFVLHAVGPVWSGGESDEERLLGDVHRRCLELAREHDCESVAFPAISTGAYGFPLERAARTAIGAVVEQLRRHAAPRLVRFVLFDQRALNVFTEQLAAVPDEPGPGA